MPTVALPVSIRRQVLAIIAENLGRSPSLETPLAEFRGVAVAGLLIDLEQHFDIGIEVDEVLGERTIADLIALVERRAAAPSISPAAARLYNFAMERARRARPDDAPGEGFLAVRARLQAQLEDAGLLEPEPAPTPATLPDLGAAVPAVPPDFEHPDDRRARHRRALGLMFAIAALAGAGSALLITAFPHGVIQ